MGIVFVQTTPDKALPLLWDGNRNALKADPAWAPFADYWYYQNLGLSALYSSIEQFTKIPDCIIQNNRVLQPNLSTNNTTLTISSLGGTRLLTTKEVEAFRLTLSLPGLYAINDKTGYLSTTVSVGIYCRVYNPADPNNTTNPWHVVNANYAISGKQRAEILKTIDSGDLRNVGLLSKPEYLDILIVRNTPSHTGNMKIIDEVYVKELTEINYAQIAYNNTALLGVKIRATDQLSGQPPTITTLVKGTKIAIPSNMEGVERYNADGSYNAAGIQAAYAAGWTDGKLTWDEVSHTGTKYWSDNPVWCLYDLLTNRRYGLGQYYPINPDKLGLMQAQFYLMAKYCDEPVEYIDSTGATDVVKYRPRFALNIVLDQTKSAAEWVSQICTCMRAVPFYSEGIFWIDIDRPKLPTQIFNMSNIKDYSQAGTSYRQIPNCMEVQYINPLQNYEIDSFRLESKELQNNPQLEERTKALMLVGVTNFDQAKALTKFTLLAAQNRAKMVTFKAGSDVIRSMVTDVIGIQHDVPQNGYGGKVVAVEEDGTVTLSEPVTFDSLMSYYITLSDAAAVSETVQIYPTEYGVPCSTISPISVTSNTGEPYVANPGNNYIIGIASNSVALYRIASLKRDQDAMCEVTAVDYYEDLYTAADSTKDMGILVIPNYSLLQNPLRSSVTGVTASPKIYQDSTGSWKVGVDVFYDPPKNNSFWKGAMLYYAKSGTTNYQVLPENSKGSFLIPDITDPGQYTFIVTSTYTSGKQTVDDALNDMQRHPWTTEYINIYLPNDAFLEGVIALGIENQANDGTFLGKDCIVTWKRPAAIDAILSTSAGDETLGAGVDSAGEWFKEYQIEVRGLDGTTRRTLRQLSERFVYTHEMNYEDGITRSFTVTVIAYDRLGRSSAPKTITCSNPAPPAIS